MATLDRDTITLGETTTLSLSFTGGTPSAPPEIPAIPNLQVTGTGTSSQFTFENGQSTSTVSYNFNLAPRQAGDYAIPAVTVEVGGQKLSSQPLQFKVLSPSAPPPAAIQSGSQQAFLRLLLPKKTAYVGETIVAQLQVYVRSGLPAGDFQPTGFPADGFNVGKQAQGQQRMVQVGNTAYVMIPLSIALRAIKAGNMTLGPYTANLTIGSRDPLDRFFGRGGEQRQLTMASEAETVQLLPLPREGVPADFTGAVGNYTMSVTAGPTNVAVGDPITVRVQLTGRGWLDAVTLPEQPAWHDFNVYPPTSKVETSDAMGLQGTKTFEQVVTPQNTDVKALPAVTFSFFDPDQKAYRTLSQPPLALVVRPAGSAAAPSFVASAHGAQDTQTSRDIVPNKQRLGTLAQAGVPLVQRTWFLALQAVPLLGLLAAAAWRKRTDQLANNPRLRRRRKVAQVVRQGLKELDRLAAQKDSDAFFATLFRVLQEQLGARLDLPASSITEAVIAERLRPQGVPEETLSQLEDLFQQCNLARYAPVKSSQEMAALIPRLQNVLAELQTVTV